MLDKKPKFKITIILISLVAVISTGCSMLTLPSGKKWLFAINVAVMGFSTIPLTPISYAFAVELTYPTPESMSNGMMILPNKLYGALIGLLTSTICSYSPLYALAVFMVNAAICGLSALFIKEELRRLNFQNSA